MHPKNTYSFHYKTMKALRYLLVLLAAIPLILIYVLLEQDGFLLFMACIFGPMLVGGLLVAKNLKEQDKITIHDTYINSKQYGKIAFKDILTVYSGDAKPLTLKLSLKSDKLISWVAVSKDIKNKDSLELQRFINDLSEAVGDLSSFAQSKPQNSYNFHCLEIKYTYRILIVLFGGLFLWLASIIIVSENYSDELILPVSGGLGVLILGLLIYAIIKAVKSGKQSAEEIEVSETGIRSKKFGKILFEEVDSYRISSGLSRINIDAPTPSLKIRLKTGKKYRYDLNIKYYDIEIERYLAFIDAFVAGMAPEKVSDTAHEAVSSSSSSSSSSEKEPSITTINKVEEQERHQNYHEAKKNLNKAKNRKGGRIAIPISLGIGLLALVRMCDPEIVDHFKDHPMREMRKYTIDRYEQQKNRIQEAVRSEGKVFLFTNDTMASAMLYPNLPAEENEYGTGILLLETANLSDKIEAFLKHEDSLGYGTMVLLENTQFLQSSRFSLPQGDVYNYLYFTVYDSQNKLQKNGSIPSSRNRNSQKKIKVSWAVAYKNIDSLKVKINTAFPSLTRFGQIFNTIEGFNLYITAAESNGSTKTEFKQATKVVKEILSKNKVDTSKFKTEIFNKTGW